MDRQLKERLIGAAVLVATAVILAPDMPSGSGPKQAEPTSDPQLKTYNIDLAKPSPVPVASEPSPTIAAAPKESPARTPIKPITEDREAPPAPPPAQAMREPPPIEVAKPVPEKAVRERDAPPTSGWTVQVGSFGVRATSERVAAELKGQGFPAFVVEFQSGQQTMYRVRVGPERERVGAEALLQKLKARHPNATLVAP